MNIKKYVDESGLTHLWTRIEENYPTNEDLTNVINAIDEEKADKTELVGQKKSKGEIFNDYENNTATGDYSHAEGQQTVASGKYSHAEGMASYAFGDCSHAEGYVTVARGIGAHAEGTGTQATGDASHAEGLGSQATGDCSHAEGESTIASGQNQHAQGKYNIEDSAEKYAHIVGNGEKGALSNAHTLDWEGNAWFAGDIKIGGTNYDEGFSIPYTINPITIPAGRMYGDINGDGFIDEKDYKLFAYGPTSTGADGYMNARSNEFENGVFPIDYACANISKNGQRITSTDFYDVLTIANNSVPYGYSGNDYTGNYIVNPNYETEEAQFYTDISLSSISTLNDIIISITSENIDSSIFVKAEIIEEAIRIWVKRPPITNVECLVTVINNGSGKCSIAGGDSGIYANHIKSQIDTKLNQLNYTKYIIPAGRMYGDLNGDGYIDAIDGELLTTFYGKSEDEYTDGVPDEFYLCDINQSGRIEIVDNARIKSVINGDAPGIASELIGNDYTGNYILNPNFATETAQFYTYIEVPGITSTCNVSVEIATPDVDSSIFVKAEPTSDAVCIWVTRPPVSAVDCLISFNEGEGIGTIFGGDSTIYVDNALAGISSDTIVEQNKNKDIKFWVGTQEELDTVETRDENCLYFTTDQNGGAGNASAAARCTTVTLNANNWTLNANNIYVQEVQANGVSADENAQLITISPYGNGFDNHLLAAEVFCIEQKENALVFRAINDAPEGNVQLLIVLEDINWINQ